MRALAACLFVRNTLNEQYYVSFRAALLPTAAERIARHSPQYHSDDVGAAIDQYMDDLKSKTQTAFASTYLGRAFPDHPSTTVMFVGGLGMDALNYCTTVLEAVQDGYSNLKFGMPYKELAAIVSAAPRSSGA